MTDKKSAPVQQKCSKCGKGIQRFVFTCPSCKVTFCWRCWDKHYDAQLCAYSRAKVLDVL